MTTPPLVIAIHGTRLAEGQQAGRRFVERVRRHLPGVDVTDAYVELDTPPIADAVEAALTTHRGAPCIVLPLMLGIGGHVREDIPEAISEGRARVPGSQVIQTPHLGPDPRLRASVIDRITAARAHWGAEQVGVVFLGRGCSVTDANADHTRLTRVIGEEGGYALTVPAFIQVTRPSLLDGLSQLYALGFRKIVVAPNYMFAGRLQQWALKQATSWAEARGDVEVRVADVIGDCDALASVVADRYRDATSAGSPLYMAGLDLRGRRVLVAGAGQVAARRIPPLVAAGARVEVVAPAACPGVESLAARGAVHWSRRLVGADDVAGARYVIAATDDAQANAAVAAACEDEGVFCVRVDDATGGSARTPATGTVQGLTVAVLGDRTPRASRRARDVAVTAVGTDLALDALA